MADAAELVVRIRGDASDLEATISGVSQQLEELERTQSNTKGVKGVRESTSAYQGLASQLKDTGKGIKEVGENIDTITKPIQYASTALAAGGVASAKFAIDFEDSFAGVKKTVDATPEQLSKIKQGIIDLSTTGIDGRGAIPQTTTELNELAAAGGQLGISQENIIDFTEVMAQMGSATNLVGEEGAATLARFMNVMGTSQGEIRNIGSAIVDLGNHSATTESEIASMALRMGKYGSSVRMSAADVLGYSAALSSLGIEAQMGGSAIGRTWLSIEKAVANGGEGLKAFAKYSGKSAKEFKEQWNTDSSGAFNGLLKGLQSAENLTVALDDLGINNTQDIQAMMALVNGYDLVTASVERSNTAYQENTALQEEFDAKAETTASKLSVAKNNVVEIARSFGDLMLPTIVDVSNGVSQYTQKIASMDDAQKKNIITAGATVVAMGAITKGSTVLIKWEGNTVEAVVNIKKAFSAGGALAKFAPMLASIGAVAGPAVLSLGAMATATVVLYKAARKYEEYSKDWSRGGNELSDKTKTYADAARDLNSLQWELRNLQQVVNNPDTDETTLQQSKQRIEEIKNLLAEKYNMDISVNDAELDEAIEKMKRVNYLEAKQNIPDLTDYGNNKKDDYEDAKSSRELYNENVEGIKKQQQATADYRSELLMLKDAYDKGSVSQEEFNNKFNELSEATGNPNFKNSPIEALLNSTAIEDWSKELEKNLTNNNTLISENEATMAEYEKTMRELANAGLLEMEFGDTEQGLEHITTAVKNADLSMSDWATTAALVQTGQSSLDDVWQAGGDTLNNFISNYTADMQKFGASSNEIATKAALLQNGFRSIQEASEAGALDVVTKQANDLAHSMGLIPENKNIAINASGDISIIEDVQRAVDVVNGVGDVNLQVSAEGDISVLNTADSELQELVNNNQVTIKFNVDTGGFDINDLNGDKLGEITATGKVIWTNDSTEPDNYTAPPKEGNVTFKKNSAEPDGYQPEDKFATVHYTVSVEGSSIEGLSDKNVPAAKFGSSGMFVKKAKKAKGTQNFEGGLAMVNDETGISDPRELIVDKGRAFIPQGKDVLLPLSKGAKVYTASQTKAIMSGMGIPHYATGKDNSDAFTSAKDDWTHYTKTHAVTTAQELEKWLEFQEKFKSNDKDIADIEEQIFSLTQKRTQELNNLSKSYIEERAALNDWDDNGDNPIDAFTRIRDRNMAEVEAGRMTWEDYTTEMSSIGSTLYDNMTEYSRDWLEHQEKYNGMSAADYIAGIGRIQTYTEQMYAQGIISHKEYVEAKNKLNEEYLDKRKEQIEQEYNISKDYISEHTYFNDWQDNGDNPLDAYNRVMDRHKEKLTKGEITQEEYDKYQSELGSDMYSERVEQSKNWLEEQRKYYGMTDEEYIAGLKRIQQYTQEYYDLGLISRKEYNENMTELNHDMFDQAGESFDDMLQQQQDYINKLRDEFSAQEQALQDSWTVEDRKADMSETQAQLDIYANAVTDRGQQKYKELQEQMKQLQRDEELYQLQVKNNATIEKLEAEYDALENSKTDFIKSIATNIDSIDVTGIVADITQEVSGGNDKITKTLSEIIDAIKGIKIEQQNYNNNSKITINTTDSAVLGSYV